MTSFRQFGGRGRDDPRSPVLTATEPVRAMASLWASAAGVPLLRLAPRGDAHPVLVLPGLLASDISTGTLRRWIGRLGYSAVGWELGRNRGPTAEIVAALPRLVTRLADRHETSVSIVGQSLGGIYARRLALRLPEQVRQVITLGSPFGLVDRPPDGGPGGRVFQRSSHRHASQRIHSTRGGLSRALPVPSTSVYSRTDGVVDWRACLQEVGPMSENVAVHAGHLGMGFDPAVLWIVADRLAQPRHGWRPFRRPTRFGLGLLFPGDD